MAHMRTRSASPGSRFASEQDGDSTPVDVDFAGVDESNLNPNSERYFREFFNGTHFRKLSVPSSAAAGDTIVVEGVAHYDDLSSIVSNRGIRVRVSGPGLSRDYIQSFEKVNHCNTRTFRIEIPAPQQAGQTVALNVRGETKTPTGNWLENSFEGPFRVNIVTQSQRALDGALEFAPYALGGATVGYAYDNFSNQGAPLRYAGIGAGVGATSKVLVDQFGPTQFNIPTTQLAVAGGVMLAATALLQSTGASDVLSSIGESAGGAISRAGDALPGDRGGSGGVNRPELPSGR